MKFCWTTLSVNNMEESLKFYQEIVGLPVSKRYPAGPGVEICFLGEGETKVELIYNRDRKAPGNVEGITLGFEVESVDEMIKFIKEKGLEPAGGHFSTQPPYQVLFCERPEWCQCSICRKHVKQSLKA